MSVLGFHQYLFTLFKIVLFYSDDADHFRQGSPCLCIIVSALGPLSET